MSANEQQPFITVKRHTERAIGDVRTQIRRGLHESDCFRTALEEVIQSLLGSPFSRRDKRWRSLEFMAAIRNHGQNGRVRFCSVPVGSAGGRLHDFVLHLPKNELFGESDVFERFSHRPAVGRCLELPLCFGESLGGVDDRVALVFEILHAAIAVRGRKSLAERSWSEAERCTNNQQSFWHLNFSYRFSERPACRLVPTQQAEMPFNFCR